MNEPLKLIAHFDLDSFFVSVEELLDPSLKGKPVIVGGRERGVVAACSYAARKFGVHSGMPSKAALRLCPQAIVLSGTRGEYSKYSRWVTDVIAAKAPLFEKASIDEFYIDLTGMDKFFKPFEWTIALRQEIIDKTQLPISFGLASNKMIAKMATDEAKPNGYLHIPYGQEKQFLAPLKVNKIPGVGESTFAALMQMGIETIDDLSKTSIIHLEKAFGKYGVELWNKSQGIHHGVVFPYHEAKSISTENTYGENITDMKKVEAELVRMTEKIAFELRSENKMAGCIAVKIRYPDFETVQRQTTIPYSFMDDEFIPHAIDLFYKLYRKGMPIRLLGVRLSELTQDALQTNLFEPVEKKVALYKTIDDIKNRFGKSSLKKARNAKKEK